MTLFPELQDASPSVGAYRVMPMSVAEIDAHPDAGRIWATIIDLRPDEEMFTGEEMQDAENAAFERGNDAGRGSSGDDVRNLISDAEAKLKLGKEGKGDILAKLMMDLERLF